MKSILSFFLCIAVVLPVLAQSEDSLTSGIKFDRNHSSVGFIVPIAGGISKVTGKFTDFHVDLTWNDEDPSKSSVSVVIQVESVATGLENRDGDVKSESILDAASYPTITFESTDIRRNGTDFVAIGNFTMHGVTKEIFLPVHVETIPDEEDPTDLWRAFQIGYELDRRDYGINWKHRSIDFFFGYNITVDIALLQR